MKTQTLVGLAAVTVIGLSACSHKKPQIQKQANQYSGSYFVATERPKEQEIERVVFFQSEPVPEPIMGQSNRSFQQQSVGQQVVEPPRRTDVRNPAQVEMAELYAIGDKIFQNEAGGRIDQLVHWNEREDFAAMGIGHFTWYPANRKQSFGNTFPGLLDYLQDNGVQLPQWVQRARFEGAPWRTRGELMRVKNTPKIKAFAQLLYDTRNLQAKYIMDRAMRAMPKLVEKTPQHLKSLVAGNINAVANTPGGRYVLIDYTNFKGEGLNRHGGYKGQNWGLLQVLEDMRPSSVGPQALNEFADASMRILERRVRNSNPKRNEKKWLAGWRNRTNTYRNPI